MEKKVVKCFTMLLVVTFGLMLSSCASLQNQWNSKTPDEKARIIIGGMQADLKSKLEIGRSYVEKNPQYIELWNTKILPTFKLANETLNMLIQLGKNQPLTEMKIYESMSPYLNQIVNYLVQIGALKK
jgi:hypothetical protein